MYSLNDKWLPNVIGIRDIIFQIKTVIFVAQNP